MQSDNDLNLHSITNLSGWLRYCLQVVEKLIRKTFFRALVGGSKRCNSYLEEKISNFEKKFA